MIDDSACPCGSQQPYTRCCGPYLSGAQQAPTAEALMRSRYTAYARRDDAYLLRTWHPDTRPAGESPSDDPGTEWTGLEILRTEAGGEHDTTGVVEFVAHCTDNGQPAELHEISHFVREDDAWWYVEGESRQPFRRAGAKVGRNDPCPCGSGKKYKKCCGA
jgi:SEC-C motif-containing protein